MAATTASSEGTSGGGSRTDALRCAWFVATTLSAAAVTGCFLFDLGRLGLSAGERVAIPCLAWLFVAHGWRAHGPRTGWYATTADGAVKTVVAAFVVVAMGSMTAHIWRTAPYNLAKEAICTGDMRVLVCELREGADPDFLPGDAFTMDYERETLLCCAARMGNTRAISILLDAGANIERTDGRFRTPLTLARENGQPFAVSLLRERGARDAE